MNSSPQLGPRVLLGEMCRVHCYPGLACSTYHLLPRPFCTVSRGPEKYGGRGSIVPDKVGIRLVLSDCLPQTQGACQAWGENEEEFVIF